MGVPRVLGEYDSYAGHRTAFLGAVAVSGHGFKPAEAADDRKDHVRVGCHRRDLVDGATDQRGPLDLVACGAPEV